MELVITALEGGLYIAKLNQHDHSERWLRVMCQKHGLSYKANMRFYSLAHIRDYFAPLMPDTVLLEHSPAYDEMIGLPANEGTYSQPLYWYSENYGQQKTA